MANPVGAFLDAAPSGAGWKKASRIRAISARPAVVHRSSWAGCWQLLLAREMGAAPGTRVLAGLVLIAPAPYFTEELLEGFFARRPQRDRTKGVWLRRRICEPYRSHARAGRGGPAPPVVGSAIDSLSGSHLQGGADPDVHCGSIRAGDIGCQRELVLTVVSGRAITGCRGQHDIALMIAAVAENFEAIRRPSSAQLRAPL